MASRLEANKHNGNEPYLVTMDTTDIKDSYLWYSSATTDTKSHMLLGPKYGHKCLLHTHNIHTTVLRQQGHNAGNNMFLFFNVFAYPPFSIWRS